MHQRFPTGEDNPLYVQLAKPGHVRLKVALRNFSCLANAPDITHNATTIAAVVGKDDQDRKLCYPMLRGVSNSNAGHIRAIRRLGHVKTSLPARRTPPDKQARVSQSNCRTGTRT